MPHVVKFANGHIEPFDSEKLFRSIYKACLSVQTPPGEAELTAKEVFNEVKPWLNTKQEVTSADIRKQTSIHLQTYNPHAAYLYGVQPSHTHENPRFLNEPTPHSAAFHPSWLDIGKKGNWDK